jgi:hypothetical protein
MHAPLLHQTWHNATVQRHGVEKLHGHRGELGVWRSPGARSQPHAPAYIVVVLQHPPSVVLDSVRLPSSAEAADPRGGKDVPFLFLSKSTQRGLSALANGSQASERALSHAP